MSQKNSKNKISPVPRSDMTGTLVLALGVSAVLGIGIYAYLKFYNQDSVSSVLSAQDEVTQAIERDKQFLEQKLPKKKMAYPSIKDISGSWKISFGQSGVAVFFLSDTMFQITVTTDPKGALRSYSRGIVQYQQETGVLSLIPTVQAGKPDSIQGVEYKVLTMRPYDVRISQVSEDPMLYFSALQKDIAGKTYHPLFAQVDYMGAPVLKWQRIE